MEQSTTNQSETLIVGEENCSFSEIVGKLREVNSKLLREHLIDLGESLKLSTKILNAIKTRLNLTNLTYNAELGLFEILLEWKKIVAYKATLSELVSKLEIYGLQDFADSLTKRFHRDNITNEENAVREGENSIGFDEETYSNDDDADKQSCLPLIQTGISEKSTEGEFFEPQPVVIEMDHIIDQELHLEVVNHEPTLLETELLIDPEPNMEFENRFTLSTYDTLNIDFNTDSEYKNAFKRIQRTTIQRKRKVLPRNTHIYTASKLLSSESWYTVQGTRVRYDPLTKLGTGASSNVYNGYYGNIPAAVKILKSRHVDLYQNEISLWEQIKETHEENNINIVTLLHWQKLDAFNYLIVMERASSDLNAWIKDLHPLQTEYLQLTEFERKKLAKAQKRILGFIHGAAKGLKWMHECENPIIHRDIKPENILIFETRSGEIAKLGDFGISRKVTSKSAGTMTNGQGTLNWMAPETIRAYLTKESYNATKAVDIFSLGMTAQFAVSMGVHPFGKSIKHGKITSLNIPDPDVLPAILGHPHYTADHLFKWMMNKTVEGRPNALQVVQHPCFWDSKKSQDFICSVARCFDGKHDVAIRDEIDDEYRKRLRSRSNWVKKLDEDAKAVLFTWKKKDYNKDSDSAMKLVELMRDKFMHYKGVLENSKLFTVDGHFDEKKYWKYFLVTFPELITHLFCQIANREEMSLGSLRKEHFEGFVNVPDWVQYTT